MGILASRSRSRFALVSLAPLAPLVLVAGGAYAVACGDSDSAEFGGAATLDGGSGTLPPPALVAGDSGAPATTMRLAHVAQELGPVDFCYRTARSTSFEGPVLGGGLGTNKKDAGAGDGGEAGTGDDPDAGLPSGDDDAGDDAGADAGAPSVGYRTVSRYLTLGASGPLTIALVAPGATSCATQLFVADVTLDPGKLSTVAILGRPDHDGGDARLALVAFIDDRMTVPEKARVRMIHAALGNGAGRSPAGALAVRASGAQTIPLADRVEPKHAASPSASVPVDSLGYATIAPLPSPAQLAVGAADGTAPPDDASVDSWVSEAGDLDLRGGSLHTGFVLSGEQEPYEVLWCTDTATSSDRTLCTLVR